MLEVAQCPTLSRLADEGVVHSRFEDEDHLYTGMKDLFGFLVVERGCSQLWHRGRVHPVHPGDVVLLEPGEIYRDQHRDGPSTYEIVLFDAAQLEVAGSSRPAKRIGFTSPVLDATDARAQPLLALRSRLARSDSALEHADVVADAARALLGAATPEAGSVHAERPAVARARAYLRERMLEQVRLDELADHVRLDKYHLIRAFRAEVGVPPYEYLTQLRMQRARALLRAGMTSTQVASALGYCDQSQFHRHFVRIVGTTPGAFAALRALKFSAQARYEPAR
jgi:AraC-like DNA-binding protein